MKPIVAVNAPGMMGSVVAKRLTDHGIEVRTSLAGRSAATVDRAKAALDAFPDSRERKALLTLPDFVLGRDH